MIRLAKSAQDAAYPDLWKGLVACWDFREGRLPLWSVAQQGYPRFLATRNGANIRLQGGSSWGLHSHSAGTAGHRIDLPTLQTMLGSGTTFTHPFSVVVNQAQLDAFQGDGYNSYCGAGPASGAGGMHLYYRSSTSVFVYFSMHRYIVDASICTLTNADARRPHNVVGRWEGSTSGVTAVFVNGRPPQTGGSHLAAAQATHRNEVLNGFTSVAEFAGRIRGIAYYNRYLSTSEATLASLDPDYFPTTPRVKRVFFVTGVAPPVTRRVFVVS